MKSSSKQVKSLNQDKNHISISKHVNNWNTYLWVGAWEIWACSRTAQPFKFFLKHRLRHAYFRDFSAVGLQTVAIALIDFKQGFDRSRPEARIYRRKQEKKKENTLSTKKTTAFLFFFSFFLDCYCFLSFFLNRFLGRERVFFLS